MKINGSKTGKCDTFQLDRQVRSSVPKWPPPGVIKKPTRRRSINKNLPTSLTRQRNCLVRRKLIACSKRRQKSWKQSHPPLDHHNILGRSAIFVFALSHLVEATRARTFETKRHATSNRGKERVHNVKDGSSSKSQPCPVSPEYTCIYTREDSESSKGPKRPFGGTWRCKILLW